MSKTNPRKTDPGTPEKAVRVKVDARIRAFLARILGWSDEHAVELALRSLALALGYRSTLVLAGEGDMIPVARSLHRRSLGPERPFVVCDPRRSAESESVRSAESRPTGITAIEAALGGTVCVRARRLPEDFSEMVRRLRSSEEVLFVVCTTPAQLAGSRPPIALPSPLEVPPLRLRDHELDRVIDEYAADAIATLGAPASSFTNRDHAWVRERSADSLDDIEKAALRLVALRRSPNLSQAAQQLGMAPVSLVRWLHRRGMEPPAQTLEPAEPRVRRRTEARVSATRARPAATSRGPAADLPDHQRRADPFHGDPFHRGPVG